MFKKFQNIIMIGLILCLFLPTGLIWGQWDDNEDNMDWDMQQLEFGVAIERSLAGITRLSALRDVRALWVWRWNDLDTHIQNNNLGGMVEPAKLGRKFTMDYFDARIRIAEESEKVLAPQTIAMIQQIITDGAASVDPSAPPEPNPIFSDYQAIQAGQRNQNAIYILDSQVVEKLPGISAAVQSSSPNVYSFDAGLPPSSTSVIAQDDSPPSPKPTPTVVLLPPTQAPTTGGSAITLQKPLRFANNGSYAATVVVSSYIPAPGVSAGKSNASTVVFPGGNPSAQLSLPLGEYVFCYYWDLGTDADNDGYVDYAHTSTGKVTLSQTSPDRADSAQVVTLSPENVSSPNGKCGQSQPTPAQRSTPQQPTATVGLTPQELANQGYHIYTYVLNDKNSLIYQRNTFDKDSVEIKAYNEVTNKVYSTNVFPKVDLNVYISLDGKSSITFTDTGYTFTIISTNVQTQYIRE